MNAIDVSLVLGDDGDIEAVLKEVRGKETNVGFVWAVRFVVVLAHRDARAFCQLDHVLGGILMRAGIFAFFGVVRCLSGIASGFDLIPYSEDVANGRFALPHSVDGCPD